MSEVRRVGNAQVEVGKVGQKYRQIITKNSVRNRTLTVPAAVANRLNPNYNQQVSVKLQGGTPQLMHLNPNRNYLGGVTQVYRETGLLNGTRAVKTGVAEFFLNPRNGVLNVTISPVVQPPRTRQATSWDD